MLAHLVAFSLSRSALEMVAILVFACHLLAVNLAMAGPLLCIWLDVKSGRDRVAPAAKVQRRLASWSLAALVAGALLGGLLLGLVWFSGELAYKAAFAMIPRDRLTYAGLELVFSLVLIAAYRQLAGNAPRLAWLARVLAVASAANLMMHFPPLFAMVGVISHRPELWSGTLDRALYHSLLVDPEVISRVMHVWLAALATAGISVMWLAERRANEGDAAPDANHGGFRALLAGGAMWALLASLSQVPVGLWLLVITPTGAGTTWSGDFLGLALVGAGVLVALRLMHVLAAAALGSRPERPVARKAVVLLALTVLLMCAASRYFRHAAELRGTIEIVQR